ncbi:MAG: glycosyltransferase [Ilumatobacteraceae bacterium]
MTEARYGFLPTKVRTVDIADGVPSLGGLAGYVFASILVRSGIEVVGLVHVPVRGACVEARDLLDAIATQIGDALIRVRLCTALQTDVDDRRLDLRSIAAATTAPPGPPRPSISVAVCTRDRPDELRRCLTALTRQLLPTAIVVVDNAPSSDATRRLVADEFPSIAYAVEPRPGLDHARNHAISICDTDVLAFTDDDALADGLWTQAIAAAFDEEPELAALTGLVIPAELETPAQELFERLGGFGRGFRRRWFHADISTGRVVGAGALVPTGDFGTGANMAFRRTTVVRLGGFDRALDVGTPTGGGGDLDMFHRIVASGGVLRYEPAAVVSHIHRRTLDELRQQTRANGSVWSVISAARRSGRASRRDAARVAKWYIRLRWPGMFARALVTRGQLPISLPLAEVRGSVSSITGLPLRRSRRINGPPPTPVRGEARVVAEPGARIEVATVDLLGSISIDRTMPMCDQVDLLITRGGAAIGRTRFGTGGRRVTPRRLRELIVDALGPSIMQLAPGDVPQDAAARLLGASIDALVVIQDRTEPRKFDVSIVIATLDRPDDLATCLGLVCGHRTRHRVEVVVVDNNPGSGLTAGVLDRFPDVVRVEESRRGLAYARNAGFMAATGTVVVATDDDVQIPAGWLDRLVAPFERNDVMAVCGNVVPLELETVSQIDFEASGGLGKGYRPRFVRRAEFADTLRPFAAWDLGATANAAFRASLFDRPDVGLMDEALGPGMPSGVGEDSYLIYRVASAGFTVVYEPTAWVRHRHRRTPEELERQIRGYYSGHVAHNLTTLVRDGDLRALWQLGAFAKYVAVARLRSFAQPSRSPTVVARAQVHGAIRGPVNYVRSQRRVGREGRSR